MSLQKKNSLRTRRKSLRNRSKIKHNNFLPRVSIFRSMKHIYAQIIDDAAHNTLTSYSSLLLENVKSDKKTVAHQVGLELAKLAKACGVSKAVFDRGSFLYHGRVKALAEGLREGGLQI